MVAVPGDKHSKLYWSQFNSHSYVDNPSIDYFKFAALLVFSVGALIYVDSAAVKSIATVVGGLSVIIIVIILIFSRRSL